MKDQIHTSNSEFKDPDPGGQLFTDPPVPDPQHCFLLQPYQHFVANMVPVTIKHPRYLGQYFVLLYYRHSELHTSDLYHLSQEINTKFYENKSILAFISEAYLQEKSQKIVQYF